MLVDPTSFDPNSKPEEKKKEFVPAGTYVLGLGWFEARQYQNGSMYWRCRYDVISPKEMEGESFFSNIGIDGNQASKALAFRWAAYAYAVGVDRKFDTANQSEIEDLFRGKAFRAKISVKTRKGRDGNTFTSNEIDRYLFDMSEDEKMKADFWEEEFKKKNSGWAQGEGLQKPDFPSSDSFDSNDIPF